jgi:CRP-like cAMP-binding protein
MLEHRWGSYAESTPNILAESKQDLGDLPPSYFSAMSGCHLPPGSILKSLGAEPIHHQVKTLAKNVLVRLLNPLAKRVALRRHLSSVASLAGTAALAAKVTAADLKASPFLSILSDPQLAELLSRGVLRCYKPEMWIVAPGRGSAYAAVLLLSGTAHNIRRGGGFLSESHAGTILVEERRVLESTDTSGYLAKSSAVTLEIDWRVIQSMLQRLSPHQEIPLKRYISAQRQASLQASFPLTTAQLKNSPLFQTWDDEELQLLIASFRSKVAFDGESLVSDSKAENDFVVIARGGCWLTSTSSSSNTFGHSTHDRSMLTGISGGAGSNTHSRGLTAGGEIRLAKLGPGESFGEICVLTEERPPAMLVSTGVTDYWALTRAALLRAAKKPNLRKDLQDAVGRVRKKFMESIKNPTMLSQRILSLSPSLRKLHEMHTAQGKGPSLIDLMSPLLKAVTFAPGERLVTLGQPIADFLLLQAGRFSEPVAGDTPQQFMAPCMIGVLDLSVKETSAVTFVASKYCEGWAVNKRDLIVSFRSHSVWTELYTSFRAAVGAAAKLKQQVALDGTGDREQGQASRSASRSKGASAAAGGDPRDSKSLSGAEGGIASVGARRLLDFPVATPSPASSMKVSHPSERKRALSSASPCRLKIVLDEESSPAPVPPAGAPPATARGFHCRQTESDGILLAAQDDAHQLPLNGTSTSQTDTGILRRKSFAIQSNEAGSHHASFLFQSTSLVPAGSSQTHSPSNSNDGGGKFHPPQLRCGDRARSRENIKREHELLVLEQQKIQQRHEAAVRMRYRPPSPDRPSHSAMEGLDPITGPGKSVFAILQRLPSKFSAQAQREIVDRVRTASPTGVRDLAASQLSLGRLTHPVPEAGLDLTELLIVHDEGDAKCPLDLDWSKVLLDAAGRVKELIQAERREEELQLRHTTQPHSNSSGGASPRGRSATLDYSASGLHEASPRAFTSSEKPEPLTTLSPSAVDTLEVSSKTTTRVLDAIVTEHQHRISSLRSEASLTCNPAHVIRDNPVSSFLHRKKGEGVPRITRLGELYLHNPTDHSVVAFNSQQHHQHVLPSFVSAHGRQD